MHSSYMPKLEFGGLVAVCRCRLAMVTVGSSSPFTLARLREAAGSSLALMFPSTTDAVVFSFLH